MTYVTRYQENLEIQDFINDKLETPTKNLIMVVGDMNVNASKVAHEPEQNLIRQAQA